MKRKYLIIILLPLLLCSFLSVGQYAAQAHTVPILSDGLILYLPFDENSGSTALDGSVYKNNGTITNPNYVAGIYGSQLYFNSSKVVMSSIPQYENLSSLTITAWINITNVNTYGTIFESRWWVDVPKIWLYISSSENNLRFITDTFYAQVSEPSNYLNQSIFVVATYSNNSYNKLFLNGAFVAQSEFVNNANQSFTSNIAVGGFDENDNYFNGTIDDFRIYNRVLSQNEITYLYEGEPDATPTPSPSPSYTPFPEGDMSNTDWWISILVLLLIIINIFLMMLPFALVRFVFGILSLFLCMLALSYQIPLSPYLQTAGLLISALAMLFSVRARE